MLLLLFPRMAAAGTAPAGEAAQLFVTSDRCLACHNGLVTPSGQDVSIGSGWQSSMMAHSARDPYWQASVRREVLAHPGSGKGIEDECSSCHMPMARYQAMAGGRPGEVFAHLPLQAVRTQTGSLAADGVSCSMCHQITEEGLGSEESFTAGFVVDRQIPLGRRPVFGPYDVDAGRSGVMQSASLLVPTKGIHVQDSALCGSCHTLFTHALGADGEVIGELPEQVPYLEWQHSDYYSRQHCQSCHMPQLQESMHISSVLGQPRDHFSRHVFRGGNFLMPLIFNRNRADLGTIALPQDLDRAAQETKQHLRSSAARLSISSADLAGNSLAVEVVLSNLAGHKLPTAYPSRRAWIHLAVRDKDGRPVFASGALNNDGSITGNDNDGDPDRYEPHYSLITDPHQVQIYEAIMVDAGDSITTGLLAAVRFIKDNRLLPQGFTKATAQDDIAVQGKAGQDSDFSGGTDTVSYRIPVDPGGAPFSVQAELWYQPIAYRWAHNLGQQQAEEIDRFISLYDSAAADSGIVLARDSKAVQ
jgi:hypothetical protein